MTRADTTAVLVAGAGPVGLFTALELARRGVDTCIADPDRLTKSFSYALALHPGTLELLDEAGLAGEVIARGFVVNRIAFFEAGARLGELRLGELPSRFPFLVTLPQSALEDLLEKHLRERGVRVSWSHRVAELRPDERGVTVRLDRLEDVGTGYPYMRFERTVTGSRFLHARYVVGADGYHSFVRESIHQTYRQLGPKETYCVFEFEAESGADLPHEVRVVFHGNTVNVLWPLPDHHYRWAFQLEEGEGDRLTAEKMTGLIAERAPWFSEKPREITWRVIVEFEPRLVERFGTGSLWLAGDAAHLTGPVGVQSMTGGLREGRDLATRLAAVLRDAVAAGTLETYADAQVAEWKRLLGSEAAPEATERTPAWARARQARIVPLLPGSGSDLEAMLEQLGFAWRGGAR